MTSRLDNFLENSLVKETLEKLERGEEVDFPRLQARQAWTLARIGELYALEAINRTREADDGIIRIG